MLAYEIQRRIEQSSVKNGRATEKALRTTGTKGSNLVRESSRHLVSVAVYMTVSLSLLISFL